MIIALWCLVRSCLCSGIRQSGIPHARERRQAGGLGPLSGQTCARLELVKQSLRVRGSYSITAVLVGLAIGIAGCSSSPSASPKPTATSASPLTTTVVPRGTGSTTVPMATTTTQRNESPGSQSAVITYGSPTGPVVWQAGDALGSNPGPYYCCFPPGTGPGVDYSGSRGCSGGAGATGGQEGGYYVDGRLC